MIAGLFTLIILEIILGIDNVIFISILAGKLPEKDRDRFRYLGLGLAVVLRLLLLFIVSWILKLDKTLFIFYEIPFSGKSLILILGGIFLIYKSSKEIYQKTEASDEPNLKEKPAVFAKLLMEVILLDLVFSIDSIITAVGLVSELWIIYTAVIVSVSVMIIASKSIANFVDKHPSFKILALSFLMIIGVSLIAEGFGHPIPKGYIYFSMAFAFLVDILQMIAEKKMKRNG